MRRNRFEFLFECPEGLLDEILAVTVPNGHVFLIGKKVADLLDRDQPELAADADRDVGASLRAARPPWRAASCGCAEARRVLQCVGERSRRTGLSR